MLIKAQITVFCLINLSIKVPNWQMAWPEVNENDLVMRITSLYNLKFWLFLPKQIHISNFNNEQRHISFRFN